MTTDTLLRELATQVQGAVADIRRLVYELRPPALGDLGLVGALRDQAARSTQGSLQVDVEAPIAVDPLPAAVEVAASIRPQHPRTAILIVTMLDDDSVFAATRAGARGYLLKGAEPAETLRAIRAVASGEAIFSPGVAQRVMDYFAHSSIAPANPAALSDLSAREREVLTLIAQGLTNAAIAERLVLSPKTVRNYISEIYSKLQVADRVQAMLRARESGLG